jgi:tetratricopeptide (TPR) repeat protein
VYEVQADTEMRFNMLHSIREFGQERQNPKRSALQLRKLSVTILRLTTEAESRLLKEDQMAWYLRLEREHDNIRRVLEFALKEDAALGIHLCEKLWRFWSVKGHQEEARIWFRQLLTPGATPSRQLAIALFGAGRCAADQGRMNEAEDWYFRSKKVSEEIGEARLRRLVDVNLPGVFFARGQFEVAKGLLEVILAELVALGEAYGEGILKETLGSVYTYLGKYEEAVALASTSLEILSRCEDQIAMANSSLTLARALVMLGRLDEARQRIQSEYDFHKRLGYHAGMGWALHIMGELLLREGRLDEAQAACERSLREYMVYGDRFYIGLAELLLAEIAKQRSDPDARLAHLSNARAHFRSGGCEAMMDHDLYSIPIVTD